MIRRLICWMGFHSTIGGAVSAIRVRYACRYCSWSREREV